MGWRLGGMLAESLRDYRPDRPRASESEVLGAKLSLLSQKVNGAPTPSRADSPVEKTGRCERIEHEAEADVSNCFVFKDLRTQGRRSELKSTVPLVFCGRLSAAPPPSLDLT